MLTFLIEGCCFVFFFADERLSLLGILERPRRRRKRRCRLLPVTLAAVEHGTQGDHLKIEDARLNGLFLWLSW